MGTTRACAFISTFRVPAIAETWVSRAFALIDICMIHQPLFISDPSGTYIHKRLKIDPYIIINSDEANVN